MRKTFESRIMFNEIVKKIIDTKDPLLQLRHLALTGLRFRHGLLKDLNPRLGLKISDCLMFYGAMLEFFLFAKAKNMEK